jgi:hypothetical protein
LHSNNLNSTIDVDLFLYDLDGRIIVFNNANHLVNDLINTVIMVADAGYTDRGHLPKIVVIYFGNRDIKLFLKTCGKRFDDTALILERLAPRDMDLQLADSNIHANSICRPEAIRL